MITSNEVKTILVELGVKSVLTQNRKMKKSSQNDTIVFNWTIPAYKSLDGSTTCPSASKCIQGCYARQGAYIWTNTKQAHQNKLDLAKHADFADIMIYTIDNKLKRAKNKKVYIRIHDSGDFFSLDYTLSWFRVMNAFKGIDNIEFYAYTKEVERFKALNTHYSDIYPTNFKCIYSLGGKNDKMINQTKDRHARVFQTETELLERGYIDVSQNDLLALTDNPKIGLVYHGTKGYDKTTWQKVE